MELLMQNCCNSDDYENA